MLTTYKIYSAVYRYNIFHKKWMLNFKLLGIRFEIFVMGLCCTIQLQSTTITNVLNTLEIRFTQIK